MSKSEKAVEKENVRYENCCKNHGAEWGKRTMDGCQEFMPSTTEEDNGTNSSSSAYICSVCGCHRNFHTKKFVEETTKANIIRYSACCKNYALGRCKYSSDGCKAFMAAGKGDGDGALVCGVCGCHRNFHVRKEVVEKEGSSGNSGTRYGYCGKNHAVCLGKYSSTDGCLEFMAGEGEAALTCAACGCHRNFHEAVKEKEEEEACRPSSGYYGEGGARYDSDDYSYDSDYD
ncbi:hypothetical protein NMG60_11004274 [Bertholletia excelsa]